MTTTIFLTSLNIGQEQAAVLYDHLPSEYASGEVLIESLPAVLAAHTGLGVLAVCVAPVDPQLEAAAEVPEDN